MLEKNKDYIEMNLTETNTTKRGGEFLSFELRGFVDDEHLFAIPSPMSGISSDYTKPVVIVSKEKFDQLQTENEQLKKKLAEFSPAFRYREFFKSLYPEDNVERLVWITEQLFSEDRWKFWRDNYDALNKLVGFSSVEEIQDYLTNEAECDNLYEAISKLHDEVKYTSDKRVVLEQEVKVYTKALQEWKKSTGCPSPSAAKTLIGPGASWMSAYHSSCEVIKTWKKLTGCDTPAEAKSRIEGLENAVRLTDKTLLGELEKEIDAWQAATDCDTPEKARKHLSELRDKRTHIVYLNDPLGVIAKWERVTGYDRPEDFLKWKANIEGIMEAWKDDTGCDTPNDAKKRIEALNERINESEACYNHLLMLTGFGDEGEIEDALDKCDHSTLRKALVDYEFDYEALLKLTGYKTEQDIRVVVNGDKYKYQTMRGLINSLKRDVDFTEANWQKATGCDTPGRAEEKLEYYKERLSNALHAANRAKDYLDTITS